MYKYKLFCYFNIFLDPQYNGNEYRQLLYVRMLKDINAFECNRLYADIYEHPNYDCYKQVLLNNKFLLDCFESVLWLFSRTTILPLKTPLALSSRIYLKN